MFLVANMLVWIWFTVVIENYSLAKAALKEAAAGGGLAVAAAIGPAGAGAVKLVLKPWKATAALDQQQGVALWLHLRAAIERIHRRGLEQDRQLGKWAKWHHDSAQRMNSLESMVRAGVNKAKAHVTLKMRDLEGLAQVVDGIPKNVDAMEARL